MGNCCGSHTPTSTQQTPKLVTQLQMQADLPQKTGQLADFDWREIIIPPQITLRVHPWPLRKNISHSHTPTKDTHSLDDSKYYGDEEDLWFCDGGGNLGLVGGCKSGQVDFGQHSGIDSYTSVKAGGANEQDDCDFDLCEMCVRWLMYHDQLGTDLKTLVGASTPKPGDLMLVQGVRRHKSQ